MTEPLRPEPKERLRNERALRAAGGRTVGISPKVVAVAVTAVVGWLSTRYGLSLDPDVAVTYTVALLTAAGVFAPPGTVVRR